MRIFLAPLLLSICLAFMLGFVVGQAWDLGWQLPLGVSVGIFIAVLPFFTTIHHYYAVRRHNELQVQPHLIVDSKFDSVSKEDFHTYSLAIRNVGLGPAIIESYSLTLGERAISDSDAVFTEFVRLVNRVTPSRGKASVQAMFLSKGEAIDKGSEKILFLTHCPSEGRSFMQGREIAKKLAAEICFHIRYRCHYGKEFDVCRTKADA